MSNKIRILKKELQCELLGRVIERSIIIKINTENLTKNGDICFTSNLLAWRGLITPDAETSDCRNILEYYLRRKNHDTTKLSQEDILKKAEESLVFASEKWSMPLRKCSLEKGRVCLFLNRRRIIGTAIKEAATLGANYGNKKYSGKKIHLKIIEDEESELTTARLRLVCEVTEGVLRTQGYEIGETDADVRYSLTTKSEGPAEADYKRHVCGVVKNQSSNTKETSLNWKSYVDEKIRELASLAETKLSESNESLDLEKIARAVVTFELLAVKPSRPVFVRSSVDADKAVSSFKGGSFVLYNAARICAILERFEEEGTLGKYPSLSDIDEVDFGQLNQEEEWELVYNFVLGYPETIENSASNEETLETSPQTLCLFLSRLSQRFSVYYRRVRILTEGRDHLVATMMARLYLLRALRTVVNNSLAILNIVPLRRM